MDDGLFWIGLGVLVFAILANSIVWYRIGARAGFAKGNHAPLITRDVNVETVRGIIVAAMEGVLFDDGSPSSPFNRMVKAEDTAWRFEVAANRAMRFIRHVSEFGRTEEMRERALGVITDMHAIMSFADRDQIESMLERFPDWAPKTAGEVAVREK